MCGAVGNVAESRAYFNTAIATSSSELADAADSKKTGGSSVRSSPAWCEGGAIISQSSSRAFQPCVGEIRETHVLI